jgi:hypothetical protein
MCCLSDGDEFAGDEDSRDRIAKVVAVARIMMSAPLWCRVLTKVRRNAARLRRPKTGAVSAGPYWSKLNASASETSRLNCAIGSFVVRTQMKCPSSETVRQRLYPLYK